MPRPATLAPKHIRELLWHLKRHPIMSLSLLETLAKLRGTRPARFVRVCVCALFSRVPGRNGARDVPRPAALAPKHIRELLWHLKSHPIMSLSLLKTLAKPRGTRPARSFGFALIHRWGACDAPLVLHSFTGGDLRFSFGFTLMHSFTGGELRCSVGFALMLSWPCHTDSTFGESNSV